MKNIFQSKTFWVNFIVALISIISLIDSDLLTALGIDSKKALIIIASITSLLNILLRLLTKKSIVFYKK